MYAVKRYLPPLRFTQRRRYDYEIPYVRITTGEFFLTPT